MKDIIRVNGKDAQFDVDIEINVDKGDGTEEDIHNVNIDITLSDDKLSDTTPRERLLAKTAAKAVFNYCFLAKDSRAMDEVMDDLHGGSTEVAVSLTVPSSSPLVPFLKEYKWWEPSQEEDQTLFIGFWSYSDGSWSD